MGDLIAAMDATAHAALVYRSQNLKGASLTNSARAVELAQRCGGASTPALLTAAFPLTDREREIVMLIRQGRPTRVIAPSD